MARGRRRRERRNVRRAQREQAAEREALERRWFRRIEHAPERATEVTAGRARTLPRHRWLPYRQGFSPALVARFLEETAERRDPARPVLDPFSGSGTTVIECARRGVAALGVEPVGGLVAATALALSTEPPPALPALPDDAGPAQLERVLSHPAHRGCLWIALARGRRGDGGRRRSGGSLPERLAATHAAVCEDTARDPVAARGLAICGDARALPVRSASVGAVLTSPPYVSRFDYVAVAGPLARALGLGRGRARRHQLPAALRRRGGRQAGSAGGEGGLHPAARECHALLLAREQYREAHVVARYTRDMGRAIAELARVCVPGAPAWIVVGGAFVREVYFPADLILAELAERAGFELERVVCARHLAHSAGRRLGGLERVLPRESILQMRRVR
ncbi:MAG: hypothetical protein D6776_01645 [Planctomycetota bacterium]|nr:MAG: hypothetical protein D6776_01645 [Planctomycetota bacterium]